MLRHQVLFVYLRPSFVGRVPVFAWLGHQQNPGTLDSAGQCWTVLDSMTVLTGRVLSVQNWNRPGTDLSQVCPSAVRGLSQCCHRSVPVLSQVCPRSVPVLSQVWSSSPEPQNHHRSHRITSLIMIKCECKKFKSNSKW